MSDKYWTLDPKILLDNYTDFFPDSLQTPEQSLNSITRLSLYISIILSFYKSNYNYMYIFLLTIIILTIIYETRHKKENYENEKDKISLTVPTSDNPMMNLTMKDYMNYGPDGKLIIRPPIANPLDPKVRQEMSDRFYDGLYQDVNDVFSKHNAHLNFYTMPSTTIPNDIDTFKKWVYGDTIQNSCKKDSKCLSYSDIRNKRS